MNPRPIIISSIIAVLFVVAVYLGGKYAIEQGRVEDTHPPRVSRTPRGQVDRETKALATAPSNVNLTQTNNAQETGDTQEPAPAMDNEVNNTKQGAETPTTPSEEASQAVVGISPFGLGPYPEVPADFPNQEIWENVEHLYNTYGPEKIDVSIELKARVRLKLWIEERKNPVGMVMEDGLVCPLYPGLVYVTWEEFVDEDGTVERYARNLSGPSDLISREDYQSISDGAYQRVSL